MKTKAQLDPISIFSIARQNGWKGYLIARKLGVTPQAVSKAYRGDLPSLLMKISKIVKTSAPASSRRSNHSTNPLKTTSKASKRGGEFSPLQGDAR